MATVFAGCGVLQTINAWEDVMHRICDLDECEKHSENGYSFIYRNYRYDFCCETHMSIKLARLKMADHARQLKVRPADPLFDPDGG